MAIHTILVTGANGQLGWELGQLAKSFPAFKFVLVDRSELDLSFPETFEKIIHSIAPDCIINTAAYTAVDKSETEKCWALGSINSPGKSCCSIMTPSIGDLRLIWYFCHRDKL